VAAKVTDEPTVKCGEPTARDGDLIGEQAVLDRLDPHGGLARDVHEHRGLLA
jgi:hypothetical protein